MPKFNRQNSGLLHWFLVISSPLAALLLVYTTGTAFSGLSLWVLYTAALISLSRSPLTKEGKSVDTEPRASEPAVVSTENIRMTYSSVIPAIMSLVAVTTILALDGIFGVSLLPIMSFEELAASVYLLCSLAWLLYQSAGLVECEDSKKLRFLQDNEATLMNVIVISFFGTLGFLLGL